ncbi:hypothetical protein GF359_02795 [candidate division WOR-3 bacterium]|uniref:Uncharacterized protein n=1 Tax=candidate division WOR-3 bacterium TaxID=2052148 RepID=A0A9D5QCL9_UNCW3|nr:hypothetical protein [candidate division WOR-3 bacterium]MBD3364121.1 hypothetical protein [candidate division WOR-3 bacterium]
MNRYALIILPVTVGAAAVAVNLIVYSGRRIAIGREYYEHSIQTSPWAQSYLKQGGTVAIKKRRISGAGVFFSILSILAFLISLAYVIWRFFYLDNPALY